MPSITGNIELKGTAELRSMIAEMPREVKKAQRSAMNAGGTPILSAMRKNTPTESGLLKKSEIKKVKVYSNGNGICVMGASRDVSGKSPPPKLKAFKSALHGNRVPQNYFHIVDGGAKPHSITITKGPAAGITIQHPGAPAHPIIEPAYRQEKEESAERTKEKFMDALQKASAKHARKGS